MSFERQWNNKSLPAFSRHEVGVLFLKSVEFLGQIQMNGWKPLMLLQSCRKGRSQVAYVREEQKAFLRKSLTFDFIYTFDMENLLIF